MMKIFCTLLATTALCGLLAVTPARAASEEGADNPVFSNPAAVTTAPKVIHKVRTKRSRTTVSKQTHTVVINRRLTNQDVTAIQKILHEKGFYKSRVDGQFGPGTQESMRDYQSSEGLEANGYPTAETLDKLGVTPENPPVKGSEEPPGKGGVVYSETMQVNDMDLKRVTGFDKIESPSPNGASCLKCTNGPIGNGDTKSMHSNEY